MRFDEAVKAALSIAEEYAVEHQQSVIAIRDLLGRTALAIEQAPDPETLTRLQERLHSGCSPFVGGQPVIVLDEMFAPELIIDSPDRRPAPLTSSPSGRVSLIERGFVGSEWLNAKTDVKSRRVSLYGFKGGVGRSSATFALAQHMARRGLAVLVIDLDLESAGISTMLAPDSEDEPTHGILDHLVEYGVGNAEGLDLVAQSRSVGQFTGNGEVWFSSVAGRPREGASYLDKLSRAYVDLPANPLLNRSALPFGRRLEAAVSECEAQVASRSRTPDVVLLDSRSGIHDVAAVAITQLSGLSLLFATDNPQTWQGYTELFSRWQNRLDPSMRNVLRDRIQMVSAMTPQRNRSEYIEAFADRSQSCFAATIYDDAEADAKDAFNFAPQDVLAPHYPISINHSVDLIGLVPGVDAEWAENDATTVAYSEFVTRSTDLILEPSNA